MKIPPSKLLSGVVVPTITPLRPDGSLDEAGFRRLLGLLLASPISGLFVVGTTGEGPALSLSTRRHAVEVACEMASGRMPVVVAAIESSEQEILNTSDHAMRAGADAIAISPPYYLALSEDDIVRVGEMVDGESPLPAYLYNVPYAHLPQFSIQVLRRLNTRPRLLGLKDSSGNFEQLCTAIDIFRSRPECSVLVGPESLLSAALRAGADGGVSGGANLFPRLYAALVDAARRGDDASLDELQARVLRVEEEFYRVGDPASSLVRGLKAALAISGVCSSPLVAPYLAATDEEYSEVQKRLENWQDVVLSDFAKID